MKVSLILTIVGADHTGIVNKISDTVSAHGGNWHESRMAHLAGQFAGVMRAQVEADHYNELRSALEALSSNGLQVAVVKDGDESEVASDMKPLSLEITGNDQPGIVRDITAVLTKHQVNVEEFSSEVSPAPMSSHELFKATAEMCAPNELDLDVLQGELESLSHDLIIELDASMQS